MFVSRSVIQLAKEIGATIGFIYGAALLQSSAPRFCSNNRFENAKQNWMPGAFSGRAMYNPRWGWGGTNQPPAWIQIASCSDVFRSNVLVQARLHLHDDKLKPQQC